MVNTRQYHYQLRPNLRQGFYFFPNPNFLLLIENMLKNFVPKVGIEPTRTLLSKGF